MTAIVVEGNVDQIRIGPGKIWVGAFGEVTLPATLAACLDETALVTDGYRELGFTQEGSAITYAQTSEGHEVAERLRPVKYIITAVEMTFETIMDQFSPENIALATNSPTSAIVTTATEVKFIWPKAGGTARVSILWVADDGLEAAVLARCFAGGEISIPRRKGIESAAVGVTFNVEENSDGDDAWHFWDLDLVDTADVTP